LAQDNDPNIDSELNEYLPLHVYGFDVVASTVKLVTTSVAVSVTHLGLPTLSDPITNNLKKITVTKYTDMHTFTLSVKSYNNRL
jgi:hypothetical protein